MEELSALIADVETDRKGVPVLLKQYLKLGGELVAFHVDRRFADALDGLIVVDLRKTDATRAGALYGQRRRDAIFELLARRRYWCPVTKLSNRRTEALSTSQFPPKSESGSSPNRDLRLWNPRVGRAMSN